MVSYPRDKLADTVDELCARSGEAPAAVTVGRRRLIRREAGEAWLKSREQTAAP